MDDEIIPMTPEEFKQTIETLQTNMGRDFPKSRFLVILEPQPGEKVVISNMGSHQLIHHLMDMVHDIFVAIAPVNEEESADECVDTSRFN
jgi:hypothetical protein